MHVSGAAGTDCRVYYVDCTTQAALATPMYMYGVSSCCIRCRRVYFLQSFACLSQTWGLHQKDATRIIGYRRPLVSQKINTTLHTTE